VLVTSGLSKSSQWRKEGSLTDSLTWCACCCYHSLVVPADQEEYFDVVASLLFGNSLRGAQILKVR
jgi:hypothetical protein